MGGRLGFVKLSCLQLYSRITLGSRISRGLNKRGGGFTSNEISEGWMGGIGWGGVRNKRGRRAFFMSITKNAFI